MSSVSYLANRRPTRCSPAASRGIALLAWIVLGLTTFSEAQVTWDYSPYRIRVWVAFDRSGTFSEEHFQRISDANADRGYALAGATWDIRTHRCPEELRSEISTDIEAITIDEIQRVAPDRLKIDDKLVLLSVRAAPTGVLLAARELDCHARTWQPVVRRQVIQPTRLADEAFAAVLDSFTPIVRIETVRGKDVEVRVRAGGLIMSNDCPAYIADQDNLRPVIRRNDRLGEPMENGILVVPWTFLTIASRQGNLLSCQSHSGQYSMLGMRASARTQKLALVAKPPGDTTRLKVVARGTEEQVVLPGYEIYSKDPVTEKTEPIGKTDWRGMLDVARGDQPLQILYVRNGGQLLARLPMVPGLEEELIAEVRSDDRRLEAEGYVKGLQATVLDLVARRQLYTSRFRRHLKNKEFDQAQALFEEFSRLPTRSALVYDLLDQKKRFTSSDLQDRPEQIKIDKIFSDTQQLLSRFLKDDVKSDLLRELQASRGAE